MCFKHVLTNVVVVELERDLHRGVARKFLLIWVEMDLWDAAVLTVDVNVDVGFRSSVLQIPRRHFAQPHIGGWRCRW
jgi:hypothetical protein